MQPFEWREYGPSASVRFPTTLGKIEVNGNQTSPGEFTVVVHYNANDGTQWQTYGRMLKTRDEAVDWGNQTAKKLVLEEAAVLIGL